MNDKLYELIVSRFIESKAKKYKVINKEQLKSLISKIPSRYENMLVSIIQNNNCYFTVCPKKNAYFSPIIKDSGIVFSLISLSSYDDESLYHELGHLFDYYLCNKKTFYQLSYDAKNIYGKSLSDLLIEEITSKKELLLNMIIDEYKQLLSQEFSPYVADNIVNYYNAKQLEKKLLRKCGGMFNILTNSKNIDPLKLDKYYKVYNDNLNKEVTTTLYKINFSKSLETIYAKYELILDVLSKFYNLEPYLIKVHSQEYYKNPSMVSTEFTANLFSLILKNEKESFDIYTRYLPISIKEYIYFIQSCFKRYYNIDVKISFN